MKYTSIIGIVRAPLSFRLKRFFYTRKILSANVPTATEASHALCRTFENGRPHIVTDLRIMPRKSSAPASDHGPILIQNS